MHYNINLNMRKLGSMIIASFGDFKPSAKIAGFDMVTTYIISMLLNGSIGLDGDLNQVRQVVCSKLFRLEILA